MSMVHKCAICCGNRSTSGQNIIPSHIFLSGCCTVLRIVPPHCVLSYLIISSLHRGMRNIELFLFFPPIVHVVTCILFAACHKWDSVSAWSNTHWFTVLNFHKPIHSITHESLHGSLVSAADNHLRFSSTQLKDAECLHNARWELRSSHPWKVEWVKWSKSKQQSRLVLISDSGTCFLHIKNRDASLLLFTWSKAGLRANVFTSASF